jgi:uncharacterized small protein (DUF1192 family)
MNAANGNYTPAAASSLPLMSRFHASVGRLLNAIPKRADLYEPIEAFLAEMTEYVAASTALGESRVAALQQECNRLHTKLAAVEAEKRALALQLGREYSAEPQEECVLV